MRPRRTVFALLVAFAFAFALSVHPAGVWALTISEPTIVGPSGPVHHVTQGGFDGGYDWVSAQGFGQPQVDGALWEAAPLTPGDYEVEAWIPNEFGTADARYTVLHDSIASEVLVSQYEVESGAWVKLGAYEFNEAGASVSSTDAAGDPGDRIDWSDMRWTAIPFIPPNVEVDGTTTIVREPSIAGSSAFVSRCAGVGYGESLWVASAQGQGGTMIDTATWSASLPAGEYAVEVYIPGSHREAEVGYTIHTAEGNIPIVISQPHYTNIWVNLGRFRFGSATGSATAEVTSSDNTGEPEQDIAWNALRFVRIPGTHEATPGTHEQKPAEPSIESGQPNEPGKPAQAPSGGSGGVAASKESLEPLLSIEEPLWLPRIRLNISGRLGPPNTYKLRSILKDSRVTLRYYCRPCYVVKKPFKRSSRTHTVVTERWHRSGDPHTLRGIDFYKGTVLLVDASKRGYSPRLIEYRLTGKGPAKPEACDAVSATTPRCVQ